MGVVGEGVGLGVPYAAQFGLGHSPKCLATVLPLKSENPSKSVQCMQKAWNTSTYAGSMHEKKIQCNLYSGHS